MKDMQMKLFDVGHTLRPKYFSDEVLGKLLDELVPRVLKWIRDENGPEQGGDDLAALREDLGRAVEYEDEAYEIVKDLDDRCHWTVDDELIDVMGCVPFLRHDALDDATNQWVLQNGILPTYSVGQRVSFKDHKGILREGEITRIDEKHAKYTVFCEAMGHVKKGVGTHGTILSYEDVKTTEGGG